MAFVIDRTCLLLTVFILSMFTSSFGDCPPELRNRVIKEGDQVLLPFPMEPSSTLHVAPSDVFFNIKKTVTDESGQLTDQFKDTCKLNGDGLTITNASATPGKDQYSSAGPYMYTSESCNITVKVLIIRKSLYCLCVVNPTSPETTTFGCAIEFADTQKNEMYPHMTLTHGGNVLKNQIPQLNRVDKYGFISKMEYVVPGRSLALSKEFNCQLKFTGPSRFPIPHMDERVPDFSDSVNCNVECI